MCDVEWMLQLTEGHKCFVPTVSENRHSFLRDDQQYVIPLSMVLSIIGFFFKPSK